jgi:glutathione S-transferase
MLNLYQAEWCPHSQRVRQRLTELGVDFVALQVPVEPEERLGLRGRTGQDEIPAAVFDDDTVVTGDGAIVEALERRYPEPAGAEEHREKARSSERDLPV